MHKISIRSTLQSSAAALTLLGASVASAFDCPRDLSTPPAKPDVKVTDAGEADFPDAHIEYRSWGWVDGSSFMCNCVRNLHSRAVKIDWDGVELSGYPTLNDDLSSMESVQGLDYVEGRPTTITFGTRTRQIKAAFETEDIDTAEASTDGGKYSDSTHEGPATFSTGKISVPRLDLLESVAGDEEQVMAALSREPIAGYKKWL